MKKDRLYGLPVSSDIVICLHCIDEVAVSDLVYRSLAHNVSSDSFLKRHILLSRLKTTPFKCSHRSGDLVLWEKTHVCVMRLVLHCSMQHVVVISYSRLKPQTNYYIRI